METAIIYLNRLIGLIAIQEINRQAALVKFKAKCERPVHEVHARLEHNQRLDC